MPRHRGKRAHDIRPEEKEANREPGAIQLLTGALVAGVVLLALLLMRQERWTLTVLDGAFWAAAAALLLLRGISSSRWRAEQPPRGRWMQLLVGAAVVGAVWLAAQAVGADPSG